MAMEEKRKADKELDGVEGDNSEMELSSPADRYNLVYMAVFIPGIAYLIPWNMFITARGYFTYQLRNISVPPELYDRADVQTDLQVYYESAVAIAYSVTTVLSGFATMLLADRISAYKRTTGGLLAELVILILTLILTKLDVGQWQVTFFCVTMVSVILIAASTNILGTSLFGVLACFPQKYIQSAMTGGAVAGLFATLANIVTLAIEGSVLGSAFWYFLSAVLVIVAALLFYNLLYKLNFSKFYLDKYESVTRNQSASNSPVDILSRIRQVWLVFRAMGTYSGSVMAVSMVTILLFPAATSAVQSINKDNGSVWTGKYFVPLYCFLTFNIGDVIGRSAAAWVDLPKQSITIPLLTALRLVFIPLFMLCNIQPRSNLPVIFNHDAYPVVFMLLLSTSNGYLMTKTLMIGPTIAPKEHIELGGMLMMVTLTLGLAIGSWLSYAMVLLIKEV